MFLCTLFILHSLLQNFSCNSLNVFSSYQKNKKEMHFHGGPICRLCFLLLFSNSYSHHPLSWHLDNNPSPWEVLLFNCSRKHRQKQIPGLHTGKHWGCPNPRLSPALLCGSSQALPATRHSCTPRHRLPNSGSGPSAFSFPQSKFEFQTDSHIIQESKPL